jgi:hypothetical protein
LESFKNTISDAGFVLVGPNTQSRPYGTLCSLLWVINSQCLGHPRHCSFVSSACEFASLECFPKVSELLPEQLLFLVEDEADELPVDPTNGRQPQYEAGRIGNVMLGSQKPVTGTIGGETI